MQIIVNDPAQPNLPPVAIAGDDQNITLPDNFASLNGSASYDPDNNINAYAWTKISGPPSFNISNADSSKTQITMLVEGVYQVELKVTDAGGLFSKDTIQVIVNAIPSIPCTSNRSIINVQLINAGKLSAPKSNVSIGVAGNKIVFGGDYEGNALMSSSTVDIYDFGTNSWSTAQLSNPRHGMAVVTAGNKIFFGGGYFTNEHIAYLCNTVDIYDAATNSWAVDSLSYKTSGLAAASVGNKVFFAGGSTENWLIDFYDEVDIYDLITETW